MATYRPAVRTEIERQRKFLDELFARAEEATELELRADLAKYACLRLTGFLEQSVMSLGIELVRQSSGSSTQAFALSHLEKSFNPNADALLKFVARFNKTWRDELSDILNIDEKSQDLNALVGSRNQIAHGKNQGISIQRVREYRDTVDGVIDHLLNKFVPVKT